VADELEPAELECFDVPEFDLIERRALWFGGDYDRQSSASGAAPTRAGLAGLSGSGTCPACGLRCTSTASSTGWNKHGVTETHVPECFTYVHFSDRAVEEL